MAQSDESDGELSRLSDGGGGDDRGVSGSSAAAALAARRGADASEHEEIEEEDDARQGALNEEAAGDAMVGVTLTGRHRDATGEDMGGSSEASGAATSTQDGRRGISGTTNSNSARYVLLRRTGPRVLPRALTATLESRAVTLPAAKSCCLSCPSFQGFRTRPAKQCELAQNSSDPS